MTGGRAIAVVVVAIASLAAAGCSHDVPSHVPSEARDDIPVSMAGGQFTAHEKVDPTAVHDYQPERGDVIVFKDPGGWLAPASGTDELIKRVIGLEGDVIECCGSAGELVINGDPLDESDYVAERHGRCAAELWSWRLVAPQGTAPAGPCDWTIGPVPPDTMFVLGDNRNDSADSRFHFCAADDAICDDSPWVDTGLVVAVVN